MWFENSNLKASTRKSRSGGNATKYNSSTRPKSRFLSSSSRTRRRGEDFEPLDELGDIEADLNLKEKIDHDIDDGSDMYEGNDIDMKRREYEMGAGGTEIEIEADDEVEIDDSEANVSRMASTRARFQNEPQHEEDDFLGELEAELKQGTNALGRGGNTKYDESIEIQTDAGEEDIEIEVSDEDFEGRQDDENIEIEDTENYPYIIGQNQSNEKRASTFENEISLDVKEEQGFSGYGEHHRGAFEVNDEIIEFESENKAQSVETSVEPEDEVIDEISIESTSRANNFETTENNAPKHIASTVANAVTSKEIISESVDESYSMMFETERSLEVDQHKPAQTTNKTDRHASHTTEGSVAESCTEDGFNSPRIHIPIKNCSDTKHTLEALVRAQKPTIGTNVDLYTKKHEPSQSADKLLFSKRQASVQLLSIEEKSKTLGMKPVTNSAEEIQCSAVLSDPSQGSYLRSQANEIGSPPIQAWGEAAAAAVAAAVASSSTRAAVETYPPKEMYGHTARIAVLESKLKEQEATSRLEKELMERKHAEQLQALNLKIETLAKRLDTRKLRSNPPTSEIHGNINSKESCSSKFNPTRGNENVYHTHPSLPVQYLSYSPYACAPVAIHPPSASYVLVPPAPSNLPIPSSALPPHRSSDGNIFGQQMISVLRSIEACKSLLHYESRYHSLDSSVHIPVLQSSLESWQNDPTSFGPHEFARNFAEDEKLNLESPATLTMEEALKIVDAQFIR